MMGEGGGGLMGICFLFFVSTDGYKMKNKSPPIYVRLFNDVYLELAHQ